MSENRAGGPKSRKSTNQKLRWSREHGSGHVFIGGKPVGVCTVNEAREFASEILAAADDAEFVVRFTEDDIDAIDQAYRRAESREDWTKGPPDWLEDVRALRKSRT